MALFATAEDVLRQHQAKLYSIYCRTTSYLEKLNQSVAKISGSCDTALWTTHLFVHIFNRVRKAGRWTIHLVIITFRGYRSAAQWIIHLPLRLTATIQHFLSAVWHACVVSFVFVGKVTLCALGVCALITLARGTFRLSRWIWQRCSHTRNEIRRKIEAEARAQEHAALFQRMRQELDERAASERRREQEKARQEEAKKQQEQRWREEAARAQKRAQEHRQRQQEALKAQQKQDDQRLYQAWRERCNAAFDSPSRAREFPQPHHWACTEIECGRQRHLKACCHSLRRLFSANDSLQQTLGEEKYRWHPDRPWFIELEKRGIGDARAVATELFQVIGMLLSP